MSWKPGQLVETKAYAALKDALWSVASRNRAIGVMAARGTGLSFMAKSLQVSAAKLGISGKVVVVDFLGEEETTTALRRIAIAVGGDANKIQTVAGVSQLFDRIVESVINYQIHLLIVDQAHHLSPETLGLIGHLTSGNPRIKGLARLPGELTLIYDKTAPGPKPSFLGAVLLASAFDKDQVQALNDSCDWRGIDPLPLLSFEEMVALLIGLDRRFTPIFEAAQKNNKSEEFLLLQSLYRECRGVFARFERILGRFNLSGLAPLDIEALKEEIEDYARCQVAPNLAAPKSVHL